MAKDLAIVLNSGSVNSAVATALAAQKYRVVLLHGESTPRAGSRARGAYDLQVAHFKPYREHVIAMPVGASSGPGGGGGHAASSAAADPRHTTPLGPQLLDLLPLVAAAAWHAGFYGAAAVYLGLRVGGGGDELAQATEYVQIWSEMLNLACGLPDLEVAAPLLELEPWQVIDLGFQVAAPFDRTWTCLEDGGEPCWACRACRAREAAFQRAAKLDPMRGTRAGKSG
jgi:hypothetical protein